MQFLKLEQITKQSFILDLKTNNLSQINSVPWFPFYKCSGKFILTSKWYTDPVKIFF